MDRSATFDGRFDASVRVRATRVRKTLAEYYATHGSADSIRIELPPGSYVPRFTRTDQPQRTRQSQTAGADSTVVILQFTTSGAPGPTSSDRR